MVCFNGSQERAYYAIDTPAVPNVAGRSNQRIDGYLSKAIVIEECQKEAYEDVSFTASTPFDSFAQFKDSRDDKFRATIFALEEAVKHSKVAHLTGHISEVLGEFLKPSGKSRNKIRKIANE